MINCCCHVASFGWSLLQLTVLHAHSATRLCDMPLYTTKVTLHLCRTPEPKYPEFSAQLLGFNSN